MNYMIICVLWFAIFLPCVIISIQDAETKQSALSNFLCRSFGLYGC